MFVCLLGSGRVTESVGGAHASFASVSAPWQVLEIYNCLFDYDMRRRYDKFGTRTAMVQDGQSGDGNFGTVA